MSVSNHHQRRYVSKVNSPYPKGGGVCSTSNQACMRKLAYAKVRWPQYHWGDCGQTGYYPKDPRTLRFDRRRGVYYWGVKNQYPANPPCATCPTHCDWAYEYPARIPTCYGKQLNKLKRGGCGY